MSNPSFTPTEIPGLKQPVEMRLHIAAIAGRLQEMIEALQFLAQQVELDQQCAGCRAYSVIGEPDAILYSEEWLEVESLNLQIRSHRFTQLLALMETAAEPPTLEFRFIAKTQGLDYAAEMRA
jgi:quinol monooxygenase YgiN